MSQSRDEKSPITIFARRNSVTGENFGQAQGHAKIVREFKNQIAPNNKIFMIVRESQYQGMITADYCYRSPDNVFTTGSIRFALIDTFDLLADPLPLQLRWVVVSGENITIAQARLLRIGDLANASRVAADVTSAQARTLFPAILHALERYHLPTDVRMLQPGDGEGLYGPSAAYYGRAYGAPALDEKVEKKREEKISHSPFIPWSLFCSLPTAPTLFASSVSSSSSSSSSLSTSSPSVVAPVDIDAVAEGFNCPLGLVLMRNPVIAADGHNYEEHNIREWIRMSHGRAARSPMDNKTEISEVFPNIELRNRIHASVLASPALAKEFFSVNSDAILHPRLDLGEIDFSLKFKVKYPDLLRELALEGSRAGVGR